MVMEKGRAFLSFPFLFLLGKHYGSMLGTVMLAAPFPPPPLPCERYGRSFYSLLFFFFAILDGVPRKIRAVLLPLFPFFFPGKKLNTVFLLLLFFFPWT